MWVAVGADADVDVVDDDLAEAVDDQVDRPDVRRPRHPAAPRGRAGCRCRGRSRCRCPAGTSPTTVSVSSWRRCSAATPRAGCRPAGHHDPAAPRRCGAPSSRPVRRSRPPRRRWLAAAPQRRVEALLVLLPASELVISSIGSTGRRVPRPARAGFRAARAGRGRSPAPAALANVALQEPGCCCASGPRVCGASTRHAHRSPRPVKEVPDARDRDPRRPVGRRGQGQGDRPARVDHGLLREDVAETMPGTRSW